jgi:hypothetical protein
MTTMVDDPSAEVVAATDEQAERWGEGRLVFRRPEVGAKRSAQLDVITSPQELKRISELIIEQLTAEDDS